MLIAPAKLNKIENIIHSSLYLGNSYVDFIPSMESSGSDAVPSTSKMADQTTEAAVESIMPKHKETSVKPTQSIPMETAPFKTKSSFKKPLIESNSKTETYEEYFSAVRSVEKERIQKELADSEMNRYLKYLKITKLERELGLTRLEIDSIRKLVVAQAPITELPVLQKSVVEIIGDSIVLPNDFGFTEDSDKESETETD